VNYNREQAIGIMNNWGFKKIPFLFFIDFEMLSIQLFRTDEDLPAGIKYSVPISYNDNAKLENTNAVCFHKFPLPFTTYKNAFDEVTRQIFAGNSFLVNLTFPTRIDTNLSLQNIYDLSDAKYKLLVNNEFVVFSPESFIKIKNGIISSFPMKGTIKASIPCAEEKIITDIKEIAEHNTIVDLIRNDLSIVATDVTVKRFRYIDRITTNEGDILQVSSEIVGKLPENYYNRLGNIMFDLLPAGSVTGAPKQKTLEIINHVEGLPRGYYTGIFGCFDGENLESAVMIRFIEQRDGQLWFRSGGGITCNSLAELEYQELIDKVYVPFV